MKKITELGLDKLKEFISGDNGFTPSLKGPQIVTLFNEIGFQDRYNNNPKLGKTGMPGQLSRNGYILEKLFEINGKKQLHQLLEIVFNKNHFDKEPIKDLKKAVEEVNKILIKSGLRLESVGEEYKVVGWDFPDEIKVEVHFEDIQKRILDQVKKAQFLIWVAVAWFTDPVLLNAINEKRKEGLSVRIVAIDDQINAKLKGKIQGFFECNFISPEGYFENIVHHKFCIIDLKTVIHGSYNWTVKAQWNKENISVDQSREIAEKYALKFKELYTES